MKQMTPEHGYSYLIRGCCTGIAVGWSIVVFPTVICEYAIGQIRDPDAWEVINVRIHFGMLLFGAVCGTTGAVAGAMVERFERRKATQS